MPDTGLDVMHSHLIASASALPDADVQEDAGRELCRAHIAGIVL